jgi:hypothetical protein
MSELEDYARLRVQKEWSKYTTMSFWTGYAIGFITGIITGVCFWLTVN